MVNLRPGGPFLNRMYVFSDMKKREDLGRKRQAVNLHKLVTGVLPAHSVFQIQMQLQLHGGRHWTSGMLHVA